MRLFADTYENRNQTLTITAIACFIITNVVAQAYKKTATTFTMARQSAFGKPEGLAQVYQQRQGLPVNPKT